MDLFVLDKFIINLAKRFMSDETLQFTALFGIWIVSEIVLPSKKIKEQRK